jgi:hypothetical protein
VKAPQAAAEPAAPSSGAMPHKRFYEKVIKVKADVAAHLNLFSDVSHRHPMVTCGAVKGAAEGRRSSRPLTAPQVTSRSSSERSETQFS